MRSQHSYAPEKRAFHNTMGEVNCYVSGEKNSTPMTSWRTFGRSLEFMRRLSAHVENSRHISYHLSSLSFCPDLSFLYLSHTSKQRREHKINTSEGPEKALCEWEAIIEPDGTRFWITSLLLKWCSSKLHFPEILIDLTVIPAPLSYCCSLGQTNRVAHCLTMTAAVWKPCPTMFLHNFGHRRPPNGNYIFHGGIYKICNKYSG